MSSHADTFIPGARPGTPVRGVPTRYSLSQYVRYEPFIKDIMSRWPEPTIWTPQNIGLDTFARSLRNAIKSVLAYNWPVADIDIPKLAALWPAALISIQPGRVVCAPRDTPVVIEAQGTAVNQKQAFFLDASDKLAVKAALVLLDRKKIILPVILQGDPTDAFDYITQRELDVTIQPAPDLGSDYYFML